MGVAEILQLVALLEPQLVNVILMIKDKSTGKLSVIAVLDQVDAQVKANQDAIAAWIASHPAP